MQLTVSLDHVSGDAAVQFRGLPRKTGVLWGTLSPLNPVSPRLIPGCNLTDSKTPLCSLPLCWVFSLGEFNHHPRLQRWWQAHAPCQTFRCNACRSAFWPSHSVSEQRKLSLNLYESFEGRFARSRICRLPWNCQRWCKLPCIRCMLSHWEEWLVPMERLQLRADKTGHLDFCFWVKTSENIGICNQESSETHLWASLTGCHGAKCSVFLIVPKEGLFIHLFICF